MSNKILFCDDMATSRASVSFSLIGKPCKASTFGDPQQAIDAARDAAYKGEPFTYIILDLEMEITGVEVAETIRKIPTYKDTRIVFFSSLTSGPLYDKAKRIGPVVQKVKSFDEISFRLCNCCPQDLCKFKYLAEEGLKSLDGAVSQPVAV